MTNNQLQYQGFTNTPFLWKDELENLFQFPLSNQSNLPFKIDLPKKMMLGKRAEEFVFFDLKNNTGVSNIIKNIQINKDKVTIGELDVLFNYLNQPIHLEIVYKFYLYDSDLGNTEVDCLIGPNRKDSLREKIDKLNQKQLPLLYNSITKEHLLKKGIDTSNFEQKTYFKAQVFLPLQQQNFRFKQLNNDCVVGFYIKVEELNQFRDSKFWIPEKVDWMVQPHQNVGWLNFEQYKVLVKKALDNKKAPLCWLKEPNGTMKKFFLVWW